MSSCASRERPPPRRKITGPVGISASPSQRNSQQFDRAVQAQEDIPQGRGDEKWILLESGGAVQVRGALKPSRRCINQRVRHFAPASIGSPNERYEIRLAGLQPLTGWFTTLIFCRLCLDRGFSCGRAPA